MKVLLIWDSCGQEPIKLWEVTGVAAEIAWEANGQYVNSIEDTAACDRLSEILCNENGNIAFAYRHEFTSLNDRDPRDSCGPFDVISVCGFIP